jgi:hypothetical protein
MAGGQFDHSIHCTVLPVDAQPGSILLVDFALDYPGSRVHGADLYYLPRLRAWFVLPIAAS